MRYIFLITILMCTFFVFGQQSRCSTTEYISILKDKGYYSNVQNKNFNLTNYMNSNYTIPVVVHILYNNDSQNISDNVVFSQIETLNADYNAENIDLVNVPNEFYDDIGTVGFNFCLIQSDINGNNFSGINRVYTDIESFNMSDDSMKKSSQGGVDAWFPNECLNIWVCNLAGNLLGFATMPGDVDVELDGVVIDYEYFGVNPSSSSPYNLGRTATHEIGHYFNLEHTFYAGCSDWDGCEDTPAITSPTYGCPDFPQESCGSINMTMNYMDYTNDACMSMFTICQANVMINTLLTYRSDLISGDNCLVSLENFEQNSLLFPNPVKDKLYFDVQNSIVRIIDIYGRLVFVDYLVDHDWLDVSFLPTGHYVLCTDSGSFPIIKI